MATARPLRAHDGGLTPVVALLGLAAAAWAVSVERMSGMDMGPGTDPGRLGWFVVTWVLMMAAMMLPALLPAARAGGGSAAFVTGYLGVWTAAGVAAYAVVEAVRAEHPGWLAWDSAGRWARGRGDPGRGRLPGHGGEALVPGPVPDRAGAGTRARGGRRAARRAAPRRGLRRLLRRADGGPVRPGVMSLTWMVAVTALIVAERLLPWRTPAVYGVAAALAVLAVWIAVDPGTVPGLTLPATPMGGM